MRLSRVTFLQLLVACELSLLLVILADEDIRSTDNFLVLLPLSLVCAAVFASLARLAIRFFAGMKG